MEGTSAAPRFAPGAWDAARALKRRVRGRLAHRGGPRPGAAGGNRLHLSGQFNKEKGCTVAASLTRDRAARPLLVDSPACILAHNAQKIKGTGFIRFWFIFDGTFHAGASGTSGFVVCGFHEEACHGAWNASDRPSIRATIAPQPFRRKPTAFTPSGRERPLTARLRWRLSFSSRERVR